jgi:hypothetical protein
MTSGVMLGAGIWFDRKERYRILAQAGIGGGWALFFFTTYAMYHVPAAHVLSSQAADLVLMLAVAVAMVAHTLRYHSQVVTGLAFLLAFLTVTISLERLQPVGWRGAGSGSGSHRRTHAVVRTGSIRDSGQLSESLSMAVADHRAETRETASLPGICLKCLESWRCAG